MESPRVPSDAIASALRKAADNKELSHNGESRRFVPPSTASLLFSLVDFSICIGNCGTTLFPLLLLSLPLPTLLSVCCLGWGLLWGGATVWL